MSPALRLSAADAPRPSQTSIATLGAGRAGFQLPPAPRLTVADAHDTEPDAHSAHRLYTSLSIADAAGQHRLHAGHGPSAT